VVRVDSIRVGEIRQHFHNKGVGEYEKHCSHWCIGTFASTLEASDSTTVTREI
jgi:hypothetical protein